MTKTGYQRVYDGRYSCSFTAMQSAFSTRQEVPVLLSRRDQQHQEQNSHCKRNAFTVEELVQFSADVIYACRVQDMRRTDRSRYV